MITSAWRRPLRSFANGNCVEAAGWRTSSASIANGDCVEVGAAAGVAVRDSKDQAGLVLAFGAGAWREFLRGVKAGAR